MESQVAIQPTNRGIARVLALLCTAAGCSEPTFPPSRAILWSADLGGSFRALGDIDGDGCGDVVATGRATAGAGHVLSGKDGTVLMRIDAEVVRARHASLAAVGDVDGDGVSDLALCGEDSNWVTVFSSGSGEKRHQWRNADTALRSGEGPAGLGDVDVFGSPDGEPLWRVSGVRDADHLDYSLAPAPDLDGDGVSDVWIGAIRERLGSVRLVSGRDGATIATVAAPAGADSFGSELARIEDCDGDGLDDLFVGAIAELFLVSSASRDVVERTHLDMGLPVAYGDLDGDGRTDYLYSQLRSWRRGYLDGLYEELVVVSHKGRVLGRLPYGHCGVSLGGDPLPAGDLDGDGVPDALVPTFGGMAAISGAQIRR